ncbi:hypothetical protein [uncultured Algoriphagus sp.]|uniref:hypothetical protein n=1 Tax=uncultured Algoriphagus sp. TaxID=417365 RepID=UPI0030ECAFA5
MHFESSVRREVFAICILPLLFLVVNKVEAQQNPSKSYHFDSVGISKTVLENYLDRAITMVYLLTPDKPEGGREYLYHEDDIRMVKEIGAKFLGRAIYRWGGESVLNSPEYWQTARSIAADLHQFDSTMVIQGCLFEIVTGGVNEISIPAWVLTEFGLPATARNFSYQAMLNEKRVFVDHWGNGKSVPDISRLETKLWFYYLAGSYMQIGAEAFHLGQVELIGMNDPQHEHWNEIIDRIRKKAKSASRRGWVILDAHVPYGGLLKDGVSLIDFNSFPLRIKEVVGSPLKGELEQGYLDAIYNKSLGGVSPSGWESESLPYLVEFDNYGSSKEVGVADTTSHFVWGYDEITWFSLQSEQERNDWLRYAQQWIKSIDANGHLQMPGNRMITRENESNGSYRANRISEACLFGYNQEEAILKLWSQNN